jgi:hypothetical protein
MRSGLILVMVVAAILVASFASLQPAVQLGDAKTGGDLRYLLVHRAEKNYYELSRTAQFLEAHRCSNERVSQYKPSPQRYGFDIRTELGIRYGVYQAWKVRVVGTSDSQKMPTSTKDGVYVLIYPRNPDWKFCVNKYSVVPAEAGARNLTYTDFADGREYTLQLSSQWPRPWQIHEIKILSSNAFAEICQASL